MQRVGLPRPGKYYLSGKAKGSGGNLQHATSRVNRLKLKPNSQAYKTQRIKNLKLTQRIQIQLDKKYNKPIQFKNSLFKNK